MNGIDRVQQALVLSGYDISKTGKKGNANDPRGIGWSATKLMLEVSREGSHTHLNVIPLKVGNREFFRVNLSGCKNWLNIEMQEIERDDLMPNLQRIARTLIAAFKAADEEWA